MSIQTEINSRTARLQAILADANDSITAKSGRAAADLKGLPEAIDTIPAGEAVLQVKAVTPNGKIITVRPDAGYDGLSAVNVAGDACLVPENIAEGVTIYGVTGTHEGGAMEWEDVTVTPNGEEISFTASEGKGIRRVTVAGDENLVQENILVYANIYGVEGEAYSGLQAPSECISRLWNAISALSADYSDYINAAMKPGGPDFFVSESDEYITVGIVCADGVTVTDYDPDTTEFYSYGWLSYGVNKTTGGIELDNYWTSASPGDNFAKNIKYSTLYIEYGDVTLFPVGRNKSDGGSGDGQRGAVNLFPHLSFEGMEEYESYDAFTNYGWANAVILNGPEAVRSGTYCASAYCSSPLTDGNYYRGISWYNVSRAPFGHYFYCQGWAKQLALNEENPGALYIRYGAGEKSDNGIGSLAMPITTEGEWELVSGVIYVDPAKIRDAKPADEIWLRVGVGVGMESADLRTYADDILVVDLTETFGVGNEPTAAECRAMFADYDGVSRFVYPAARHQYYTSNISKDDDGAETLSATIVCQPGDLVVAAIATCDTFTVNDGWTLLPTSNVNSADSQKQRLTLAYKFTLSGKENIVVTQASSKMCYINMVAISNVTGVTDRGHFYMNAGATEFALTKPEGATLWALACPSIWPNHYWTASNDMPIIQQESGRHRLMVGLDQSGDANVTFSVAAPEGDAYTVYPTPMIAAALTIHGIDRFG